MIGTLFGVGKATSWEVVYRCVAAIYKYRNVFIRWPNEQEARITAERFQRRNGFRKVLGLLDGTHVRIPKQSIHTLAYMNRKKFSSIQLQVIYNIYFNFKFLI